MGEKGGAHTRLAKPENRLLCRLLRWQPFYKQESHPVYSFRFDVSSCLNNSEPLDFIFVTFRTVTHQKKAESLVALGLLLPRVGVCKKIGHLWQLGTLLPSFQLELHCRLFMLLLLQRAKQCRLLDWAGVHKRSNRSQGMVVELSLSPWT